MHIENYHDLSRHLERTCLGTPELIPDKRFEKVVPEDSQKPNFFILRHIAKNVLCTRSRDSEELSLEKKGALSPPGVPLTSLLNPETSVGQNIVRRDHDSERKTNFNEETRFPPENETFSILWEVYLQIQRQHNQNNLRNQFLIDFMQICATLPESYWHHASSLSLREEFLRVHYPDSFLFQNETSLYYFHAIQKRANHRVGIKHMPARGKQNGFEASGLAKKIFTHSPLHSLEKSLVSRKSALCRTRGKVSVLHIQWQDGVPSTKKCGRINIPEDLPPHAPYPKNEIWDPTLPTTKNILLKPVWRRPEPRIRYEGEHTQSLYEKISLRLPTDSFKILSVKDPPPGSSYLDPNFQSQIAPKNIDFRDTSPPFSTSMAL